MNLLRPGTLAPASSSYDAWTPTNVYHLHPLLAGPLNTWQATLARIAAMGFSHVCLAPPFEPGGTGDIFIHFTFDRLHPALGFVGTAEQGIALAAEMASRAGLRLVLDIAPGHIATDSPLRQRQPGWFGETGFEHAADPRRPPHRLDVVVPNFGQTSVADAIADWWIELLTRWTGVGVAGFRCLTLDVVPPPVWRRIVAAVPQALFLAWTPGVPGLRDFAGVGFDLTCSSAGWWDGRASWFLDEAVVLRDVAPALGSPEPSFLERLAQRLPADADIAAAYRLALSIAASTGAGLFMPMGFEFATSRRFDVARAGPADLLAAQQDMPADLSEDVAGCHPPDRRVVSHGRVATVDQPSCRHHRLIALRPPAGDQS